MLTQRTKIGLFFLALLLLILYLAYSWQGFKNLDEEKIKKQGGFLKEAVLSFVGKRVSPIPGEFKKETEEMKEDLIRLNRDLWQNVWQKTEKTFQNIWHPVSKSWKSFWQTVWPKIRSTFPQQGS